MDLPLLATIVSTIIAVISIAVTGYLIYLDSREFIAVSKGRRKALNGTWSGTIRQLDDIDGNTPAGTVSMKLMSGRKRITGRMEVSMTIGEKHYSTPLNLKGGFKMDRFLELECNNESAEIVQFGNLILELDPMGKSINGRVQGYGPLSQKIVTSLLHFEKQPTD